MKPLFRFECLFLITALITACNSNSGARDPQSTTVATTAASALSNGVTDGALSSEGSFGNLTSGEASDGATDSHVGTAGSNRAFGADTYLNSSSEVDQNNLLLADYFAATNDETDYAAVEAVINVNSTTGSLYSMVVATPSDITAAKQEVCKLDHLPCGTDPTPPDNSVCTDAFYSQANACTTMLQYLCQPDGHGRFLCNLPDPTVGCQETASDSGNPMTCKDPGAFTTCCAYSCKATSPGCYTPDQQIERTFGQYTAASDPVTGIVSLDRSSTLGQLNFKESHVAYFSRDAAPTEQPMRRISTNCGVELEVTPTHTFVNIDGSIKLASSYSAGDLMLTEDGSFCEVTHISDFDKAHGNEKTFQAFNIAVDSDELTEQVIVARGSGRGHGILTGSHFFQDHDISRFGRALAREQIHSEIKP